MSMGCEVSFSSVLICRSIWQRAVLAAIQNRAAGSDSADPRAASLVAFFPPQLPLGFKDVDVASHQ